MADEDELANFFAKKDSRVKKPATKPTAVKPSFTVPTHLSSSSSSSSTTTTPTPAPSTTTTSSTPASSTTATTTTSTDPVSPPLSSSQTKQKTVVDLSQLNKSKENTPVVSETKDTKVEQIQVAGMRWAEKTEQQTTSKGTKNFPSLKKEEKPKKPVNNEEQNHNIYEDKVEVEDDRDDDNESSSKKSKSKQPPKPKKKTKEELEAEALMAQLGLTEDSSKKQTGKSATKKKK
eukprot:gene3730-4647_t